MQKKPEEYKGDFGGEKKRTPGAGFAAAMAKREEKEAEKAKSRPDENKALEGPEETK